jgi:hypothetical protein
VFGHVGYFSGGNGTDIVDLSNPLAPTMITRIESADGGHIAARNVTVGENLLYQVADNSPLIHVFNVANPAAPSFVRSINTQDAVGIADLTLVDDRLYATGLGDGTYLYDVTNVAIQQPSLMANIATGIDTSSVWPTDDQGVLVATHRQLGGELAAWDISPPATATLIQSVDPSDFEFNSYSTSEVVVVDKLAYVAWYQGGLEVIDLDRLASDGMQRLGFYIVAGGSVFDEFSGTRSVYPWLGHDQILFSHTRRGLYVVDASAVQPPPPGDYDGDGEVTTADYDLWKLAYKTDLAAADGNGDGIVDVRDYAIWRKAFGATGSGSVNAALDIQLVPEPDGFVIAVLLILAAMASPLAKQLCEQRSVAS